MTGVEFENDLMSQLKQGGFEVGGTPKSGDQGADIIARRGSRVLVIQAKRSTSAVGNEAVQEVVAALAYYGGTEAWVITNSTCTKAARDLASKNGVGLIEGQLAAHNRTPAVIGKSGMRSAKACGILKQAGFQHVRNMKGGILAWSDRVDSERAEILKLWGSLSNCAPVAYRRSWRVEQPAAGYQPAPRAMSS